MTLAFQVPGSTDGWLARLDARWKIAAFAVVIIAAACLTELGVLLFATIATTVLALLAGVSPRTLLTRLVPLVGMLLLLFVWSIFRTRPDETPWTILGLAISPHGTQRLIGLLAKTVAVVVLMLTLLETTPLPELGQGAARLGVPRLFVHLVLLTHRYVFVLAEEFGRLRRALRVRGYRSRFDRRSFATIGNVAGSLFVRGHERAERVHHAMAARGFEGVFRSMAASHTSFQDVAFFVAMAGVSALAVAWDRGWLP